jgi:molecular chaperone GrpE
VEKFDEDDLSNGPTDKPLAPDTVDDQGVEDEYSEARAEGLDERAERLLANWQRAQADLANFRNQVDRERGELASLARAAVLTDLLPVIDDLERALDNVAPEVRALTWVDGIGLIFRKFQAILGAHGLAEVEAEGKDFDPLSHEAIAQVVGEPGKVISVVQKGYLLQKRLIRPALVTVGGVEESQSKSSTVASPETIDVESGGSDPA